MLVSKNKSITIDSSYMCTLECDKCRRQYYRSMDMPPGGYNAGNITLADFNKLLVHFDRFIFCGQVSDSIFNPWLIDMLEMIYQNGKSVEIATAATSKKHKEDWYRKAFEANPNARWIFGIDGLPEESCMYRINQDGEFLFEMAKLCAKMCKESIWQYIAFSYNENHIDEAMQMARENGIIFELNISARWNGISDAYKPKNHLLYKDRPKEWKKLISN